ncbi:MAG: spermidine/putrescine ABC transporter substrate-binding protein [Chloroflexi bacterium]|nr:spermidine/putrescine ABC transporter substrate-binding protein [Chloroflexota bacterium]
MRYQLFGLLWLLLLAVLPLAAQEATPYPTPPPTPQERTRADLEAYLGWTCPEEVRGGTLNLYNWAAYVGPFTVSDFETLCQVTTNFDVYASNEDMLARLRAGNPGYDIVVPSHFVIRTMIDEGLIMPLTPEHIPNLANITPELLDPAYDPGNQYTVPYQWGTVGIAYNATLVTQPFASWNDFWAYDGPVAWLEDQRAMLSIALVMLGFDPNSSSAEEIAAARDYLIANSANVVTMNVGNSQQLLGSGEVAAAIDYNGNVFQLQATCECQDYQYVIPQEGANIWVDNVAIPADAPNARLAEAFMDYLLVAQVGADLSNYTGYATPNQAALDSGLIDPLMRDNPAIYPDQDVLERVFFAEANPETELLYADAWDAVKTALAR